MAKPVPFSSLERVLAGLGFVRRQRDAHVVFSHGETDTIFLFPQMGPGEAVEPGRVASVRRLVTERGVAAAKAFDDLLEEQMAAA